MTTTTPSPPFHLRNMLVVVQVALSMVALVGAGLFLRSLQHAQQIHPGFEKNNLLSFGGVGAIVAAVRDRRWDAQVVMAAPVGPMQAMELYLEPVDDDLTHPAGAEVHEIAAAPRNLTIFSGYRSPSGMRLAARPRFRRSSTRATTSSWRATSGVRTRADPAARIGRGGRRAPRRRTTSRGGGRRGAAGRRGSASGAGRPRCGAHVLRGDLLGEVARDLVAGPDLAELRSELAKAWLTLGYSDTWSSPQRQREAAERDRMMDAIGKVANLD